MALDTRGLMHGAAQGFNMMDQYYNRQEKGERADQRLEMQQETHERQEQQAQREQEMQKAEFTLGKIAQGVYPSEDEMQFLRDNPNYLSGLDPRTDQDIENAQRVIDPEDSMDANDPEALESMNHLFGHRVNRGSGGNKRIAGIFPGSQQGKVAIDLEVEGEDGQRYNAPMTSNRGTESDGDDQVLETPVEDLVNQTQGYRMLRNAFRTPEAQENASKVLAAIRGEGGRAGKGVEINDRLVNPQTGEVIADFSNQNPEGENADWRKLSDGRLYNQRTGETKDAPGSGEINPETEYQLDLLSGELDHLWEIERRIRTGATGDFGELGVVTKGNSNYVLAYVRARIERNQKQMNRLLGTGSGSGTPSPGDLVEMAQKVPEQDREEFMADLRGHPNATEDLIQRVQQQWGSQAGQSEQQQGQTQGQRQTGAQQGQKPAPSQRQPAGGDSQQQTMGLLKQMLQSENPETEQGQQPGIQIPMRPGEQRQPQQEQNQGGQPQQAMRTPISGQPTYEGDNRFGPMIERGINAARQLPQQMRDAEKKQQLENMKEIARKGGATERERGQFLSFGIQNFDQAPKEVRKKLKAIFGEDTIQSRLNQQR